MTATRIKAALIDLSGTIHIGETAIPGAIDACRKLHSLGISVRFLTNTTKTSSSELLAQLRRIGFDESAVPENSIVTSTGAARDYIIRKNLRPLCLVEEDLLKNDLADVDTTDPNCVLVGLAPSALCYERLNEAFRLLLRVKKGKDNSNNNPCLIAIHRGKYFRDEDGELSLGPGGFVSCLEEAAGVKAIVMGKPSQSFFDSVLDGWCGATASEVVMVGDDAMQDVGGALEAGIGTGVLVRTGKFQPNDIIPEGAIVVDSIVQAVEYMASRV